MKKNKLVVDYEFNFKLLGLISTAKDYKLAWSINIALAIKLVKNQDLKIEFVNDKHLIISNYIFETENSSLRLLKNKTLEVVDPAFSYLMPELKDFDYFIIIDDSAGSFSAPEVINKIKKISWIQYIANLDTVKLKSKENLIF
ncbi:MAG: IPExxxVDY family protein [Bacteroidota bacterium]|nr:IPExxxVDY family protein [Bacteroidota bacterium]